MTLSKVGFFKNTFRSATFKTSAYIDKKTITLLDSPKDSKSLDIDQKSDKNTVDIDNAECTENILYQQQSVPDVLL